ncbi:uncharacterized protein EV154DRAFT_455173, partial [Mucor mucedo]|uniref:uncharacterized protein n=1 Tax=Mucor mucedo TaxID=29922 RepID=UPI00221FFF4E
KYADALGLSTITDNEELFIDCSSGFEKEKVSHLIDGTLKLLVECSDSLLSTIKQNKAASIHTIKKKVFIGYTSDQANAHID